MRNWLKRWFGEPAQEGQVVEDERVMTLEREAQGLRLDLQEKERAVANLTSELERLRSSEVARINEAAQAQMEQLLTDLASPVAQLLTQAHLLEVEGKPVQVKDVLTVARRLVRVLEDEGLTLEGKVGETVSFDPNHHEPLSGNISLTSGQNVVIRFVGITLQGKVLRKAGVEKVSD